MSMFIDPNTTTSIDLFRLRSLRAPGWMIWSNIGSTAKVIGHWGVKGG